MEALDRKKEKMEQMKNQIKLQEAKIKKAKKAARDHRLIENGAIAEAAFDVRGMSPEEFKLMMNQLAQTLARSGSYWDSKEKSWFRAPRP
ncbi:MAG: hypothetical protein RSA71_06650, partial [Eubacterium sp.]